MHTLHTIRTAFGGLSNGDNFIHNGVIYRKAGPGRAINCHTMLVMSFKPDQLVEVL